MSIHIKNMILPFVGFYKNSIDNTIAILSGVEHVIENEEETHAAHTIQFDIFDKSTGLIPRAVMGIFNQVFDELYFLYGKGKFEVISLSNDLVELRKDGINYSIERIETPFGS